MKEIGPCLKCDGNGKLSIPGSSDGGINLVDSSKKYKDVGIKWYKEYIDYVVTFGLFSGTSEITFEPDATITRAQFVTVLANLSGVNIQYNNISTVFTDVSSGKWYTAAVNWAYVNGIVAGISQTQFVPHAYITREQMCTMLVRYAECRQINLNLENDKTLFADDYNISNWAKESVYICKRAEIVTGIGNNKFDPKATASRAEAATILSKFHKDYILEQY